MATLGGAWALFTASSTQTAKAKFSRSYKTVVITALILRGEVWGGGGLRVLFLPPSQPHFLL